MDVDKYLEDLLAERHDAITTLLKQIRSDLNGFDRRLQTVERHIAILYVAYGLGVVILLGMAARFGFGK